MKPTLLITGGLGYIGSHAVVEFEQAGYTTLILDNLCNSSETTLSGLRSILGYAPKFYKGNIGERELLEKIFTEHSVDGVIHFAGLKAVGESTEQISRYHHNNISESIVLFEYMEKYGVKKIIFSSSATVYDPSNAPEYIEGQSLGTTNPYGTTKLVIEKLLEDYARHANWSVMSLRYFNPIGAHASGYIGESPSGIPNNLLPYIYDVASGKREYLRVFGDDYDTPDGTGIRDYIDVCDLTLAHRLGYEKLLPGYEVLNIGVGRGKSVLEMHALTQEVTGITIPYQIYPSRSGDIAEFYANPHKAQSRLNWKSETPLEESIKNGWNFIRKN